MPSFVPGSGRLAGDPVTIDILPPVRETDGPALVPGAAHVRVSLPLKDNSELMWGSDLTPLYDDRGGRLMCFTAFLPLGLRLVEVQRPSDVPPAEADLVVVLSVDPKSEADSLGIQVGMWEVLSMRNIGGIAILGGLWVPVKRCRDVVRPLQILNLKRKLRVGSRLLHGDMVIVSSQNGIVLS